MYRMSRISNKLLELLKQSILTQFYITTAFVTVACYLWLTDTPLPSTLQNVLLVVIGFYFGRKASQYDKKES
jgi:biotin transporter BioY